MTIADIINKYGYKDVCDEKHIRHLVKKSKDDVKHIDYKTFKDNMLKKIKNKNTNSKHFTREIYKYIVTECKLKEEIKLIKKYVDKLISEHKTK